MQEVLRRRRGRGRWMVQRSSHPSRAHSPSLLIPHVALIRARYGPQERYRQVGQRWQLVRPRRPEAKDAAQERQGRRAKGLGSQPAHAATDRCKTRTAVASSPLVSRFLQDSPELAQRKARQPLLFSAIANRIGARRCQKNVRPQSACDRGDHSLSRRTGTSLSSTPCVASTASARRRTDCRCRDKAKMVSPSSSRSRVATTRPA